MSRPFRLLLQARLSARQDGRLPPASLDSEPSFGLAAWTLIQSGSPFQQYDQVPVSARWPDGNPELLPPDSVQYLSHPGYPRLQLEVWRTHVLRDPHEAP